MLALAIGGGAVAFQVGLVLRFEASTVSLAAARAAATPVALALVGVVARRTAGRIERVETDFLLTKVGVGDVVLGIVLAESRRIAVRATLPVLAVAGGFALGVGAPASALLVVASVAGLLALAASVGTGLALAVAVLAMRSPGLRRVRGALTAAAYVGFALATLAVLEGWVAVEPAVAYLETLPPGWFVDLSLLGLPGLSVGTPAAVAAVLTVFVGVPVFLAASARLADRVWRTESVGTAARRGSTSILDGGVAEWLLAGRVSRPVLTVARKQWLQERRIPRGFVAGLSMLVVPVAGFVPLLARTGELPAAAPFIVALTGAFGVGMGFGLDVLGREYPTLPMTLTTVSGREFVRGHLLAGIGTGSAVTVPVSLVVGVPSTADPFELFAVAVVTVALCACTATVATALGLSIPHRDIWPVPFFFTDAPVYAEAGRGSFLRIVPVLAVLGLVGLPAFSSYLSAFAPAAAASLGTSVPILRIGLLCVSALVAIAVAVPAYRLAIQRFDGYTID